MSTERDDALKSIAREVMQLQEAYGKKTGGKPAITDKCRNFPAWDIVGKMRELADKHRDNVESKLDGLLVWPVPAVADPDLFYDGKHDKVIFNRSKDWFTTMGFKELETPYTFTDRWDKKEIKATFLVPTDLGHNEPVSVMWFFHGGGFCTGAGDHIPWYSHASVLHAKRHKAVIIAPDYPLGPEGTYQDINDSLRDFLLWYKNDLFFRTPQQPYDNWTTWLSKTAGIAEIKPLSAPIFIEGESAGGHAAVTTTFLNATSSYGIKLPIRVALLRYPMIAHYTRTFTPDMGDQKFMNQSVSHGKTQAQERLLEEEIALLERYGLVPTRVKGYAPSKMAGAFLLSMMGRWKPMFQRAHNHTVETAKHPMAWPANETVEHTWDCIERAERSVKDVDHTALPNMLIYHGANDSNCPIADTQKFVDVLKKQYPTRYNDQTVHLESVTYLSGKEKPGKQEPVTAVNHGFDYQILEEHEPWLKDIYARVDTQWK